MANIFMQDMAVEEGKKVTTDHEEIRKWAQEYGGCPEIMYEPGTKVAISVRINFPTKADDIYLSANHATGDISWEEFFREFDRLNLAFEYNRGEVVDPSSSYMFVKREMEEHSENRSNCSNC